MLLAYFVLNELRKRFREVFNTSCTPPDHQLSHEVLLLSVTVFLRNLPPSLSQAAKYFCIFWGGGFVKFFETENKITLKVLLFLAQYIHTQLFWPQ